MGSGIRKVGLNRKEETKKYWAEQEGMSAGEMMHEGALLTLPGYDLGNCISSSGCSGLDWALAAVGVIPGGKLVTTVIKGVKLTGKAKSKKGLFLP